MRVLSVVAPAVVQWRRASPMLVPLSPFAGVLTCGGSIIVSVLSDTGPLEQPNRMQLIVSQRAWTIIAHVSALASHQQEGGHRYIHIGRRGGVSHFIPFRLQQHQLFDENAES